MKLDPELREQMIAVLEALNLRGMDPQLQAEVKALMEHLRKAREEQSK